MVGVGGVLLGRGSSEPGAWTIVDIDVEEVVAIVAAQDGYCVLLAAH
jgi:hypothetical protein